MPIESSAGPVDLAFGETEDAVVDQLWAEVKPVINGMVARMKTLLCCFGVRTQELSTFLIYFDLPSDLLDFYLTFCPQNLRGTDYGNNSDTEEDSKKDDESEEDELELEGASVDRLAEVINAAVDTGTNTAATEGVNDEMTEPNSPDEF